MAKYVVFCHFISLRGKVCDICLVEGWMDFCPSVSGESRRPEARKLPLSAFHRPYSMDQNDCSTMLRIETWYKRSFSMTNLKKPACRWQCICKHNHDWSRTFWCSKSSIMVMWQCNNCCKHCQRHNEPISWHHNWKYLVARKFSQQVAPHEFVGNSCISTKFGHQMASHALVGNFATRWRHLH